MSIAHEEMRGNCATIERSQFTRETSMELSAKLIPLYILPLAVWHMYMAIRDARRYAATGDKHYISHHQDGMKWSMVWLAMTVFAIILVRSSIQPAGYQSLFWVHLPLVLAAAGIFAAIFAYFDGIRMPRVHPKLGYASIGCLTLGAGIGVYMLASM